MTLLIYQIQSELHRSQVVMVTVKLLACPPAPFPLDKITRLTFCPDWGGKQVEALCSSLRYLFGEQTGPKVGVECLKAPARLVWRICEKLGSNLILREAPCEESPGALSVVEWVPAVPVGQGSGMEKGGMAWACFFTY